MSEAEPDRMFSDVEHVVRAQDRDRWLASLFVPADMRPHVLAVLAFSTEIARVREVVHEPMPGEIRFQWWRDVLTDIRPGEGASHPVARAVLASIAACKLPLKPFLDLIDARTFDLYDDPMPRLSELEGYCGETASALFQLVALILAGGRDPESHDSAGHAGVAYAVTGLLRALPIHARRGQCYLPADVLARHGSRRDEVVTGQATPGLRAALAEMREIARRHLDEAEAAVPDLAPSIRPAFLPLALVRPYLDALARVERAPFGHIVELPQWRRQWTLWRASRRWRTG
jgi:phytoene synthase